MGAMSACTGQEHSDCEVSTGLGTYIKTIHSALVKLCRVQAHLVAAQSRCKPHQRWATGPTAGFGCSSSCLGLVL